MCPGCQERLHMFGSTYPGSPNHTDLRHPGRRDTKAMSHIYGEHPRQNYYSDNARPPKNAAILAGLTPEKSQPGVSQTNALVDITNNTLISGPRRLLCNAGLQHAGGNMPGQVIVSQEMPFEKKITSAPTMRNTARTSRDL